MITTGAALSLVSSLLSRLVQPVKAIIARIRRVRVTVHTGYWPPNPELFVFVTVVNRSLSREVEIGAVWFEGKHRIPVEVPSRPLPKRLKPDESWETWIPFNAVRQISTVHLHNAACVRLSTGKVIHSIRNATMPPAGRPPGP